MDCAMCGGKGLFQVEDLPVGPRWFCTEKHFAEYAGLPVKESGYYGFEAEGELERNYFTRFGDKRGGKEWGEYTFSWHNSVGEWKPISEDTAGWDEDDYEGFQDEKEYELVHDMLSDSNSELYKLIQNNSWGEEGHELNTNYEVLNEHGEKEHLSLSISWGEPEIEQQKIQYYDKEPLYRLEFLGESFEATEYKKICEGQGPHLHGKSCKNCWPTDKKNPMSGCECSPQEIAEKVAKAPYHYGKEPYTIHHRRDYSTITCEDCGNSWRQPDYEHSYSGPSLEPEDYYPLTEMWYQETNEEPAWLQAESKKINPIEKAGLTGIASGATMEGLETLLAAEDGGRKKFLKEYFAKLKAKDEELAKQIEYRIKNEMMNESKPSIEPKIIEAGFDPEIITEWIEWYAVGLPEYQIFEMCRSCEGDGEVMIEGSYWGGDRYDPPEADFKTCDDCLGSGLIDPSDYMYGGDDEIEYMAEYADDHPCEHCGSTDIDFGNNWKCHDCGRYAAESFNTESYRGESGERETFDGGWRCGTCDKMFHHHNDAKHGGCSKDQRYFNEGVGEYCGCNKYAEDRAEYCCMGAESLAGEMDATQCDYCGKNKAKSEFPPVKGYWGRIHPDDPDENDKMGYCSQECFVGSLGKCDDCSSPFKIGDNYNRQEDEYETTLTCDDCFKGYPICESCGDKYHPESEHMESCGKCGGNGWIMTDYDSGDRWEPASSDSRPCEECYDGKVCSLEAESYSAEGDDDLDIHSGSYHGIKNRSYDGVKYIRQGNLLKCKCGYEQNFAYPFGCYSCGPEAHSGKGHIVGFTPNGRIVWKDECTGRFMVDTYEETDVGWFNSGHQCKEAESYSAEQKSISPYLWGLGIVGFLGYKFLNKK